MISLLSAHNFVNNPFSKHLYITLLWCAVCLPSKVTDLPPSLPLLLLSGSAFFDFPHDLVTITWCTWISAIREFRLNLTGSKPVLSNGNIIQTTYVILNFLEATHKKVFKKVKLILMIYFILHNISGYYAKHLTNIILCFSFLH